MSVNFSIRKFNKSIYSKIIMAFLLGCLTVLLAWGITRITFHRILGTVSQLSQPNLKLKLVNKLFRDAVKLDQLQRAQVLKTEGKPYNPFLRESSALQQDLDSLRRISMNNPSHLKRIDSMKAILQERDQLFINYLQLRARLAKNDTLGHQIKALSELVTHASTNVDSSIVTTEKKITTTIVQPVDSSAPKNTGETKPGFWNKLFGRKKNAEVAKMEKLITEELNIKIDTLSLAKEDSVVRALGSALSGAEAYQENRRNTLINRQVDLARNGNSMISQLFRILQDIESEELLQTEQNNLGASELVNTSITRMNLILIFFILGGGLLVFLISMDISRGNKYRKQLQAAKEEAEELGQVKQRFLSNMSHELRTPLQSIIGFSEQLSMQEQAKPEDLRIIYQSSRYLLQIVNEVLDYSRITSGKFQLEHHRFNMSQLVHEVSEALSIQAAGKQLRFIVTGDLNTSDEHIGDPFRLKQILYNLLGNAIKFTDQGTVSLEVRSRDFQNRTAFTFIVKDTGKGIAEKDRTRIFNQFEQATGDPDHQQQGTGLGLSIVWSLIEAQKGTIHLQSEPGTGSEFTVALSFPKARKRADTAQETSVNKITSYKGSIWIVDDDPFILHLCDTILTKYQLEHTCFPTPEAALHAELTDAVKIVFLDMRMPGMTGMTLCEMLRVKAPSKDISFIALTAQALPDEREAIISHGFNGLLMKPFQEEDLINTIITNDVLPAQTVKTEFPDLQVDLSSLQRMAGGDAELLQRLLSSFIEETSQDLGHLKLTMTHDKPEEAAEYLHRMAGRCGQMGAGTVSLQIRKAEIKLRAQRHIAAEMNNLEAICQSVEILISQAEVQLQERITG